MRALVFWMTLFFACTTDLSVRWQWKLLPSCLIVSGHRSDEVLDAARAANWQFSRDAFHVYPDCSPGDELVPLSFVAVLPPACAGANGCTITTRTSTVPGMKQRPMREVLILDGAEYRTIQHELEHLAGCQHLDWPPC